MLSCSAKDSLTCGEESVESDKNIGIKVGFIEDGSSAIIHELD